MAFYKHMFLLSLVLALSLSSTNMSLAARHLWDTPADPNPLLLKPTIPVGLFPYFPNLPKPRIPQLPATQNPSLRMSC